MKINRFAAMGIERYKPAVAKEVLLFMAGLVWELVGVVLVFMAVSWLGGMPGHGCYPYAAAGIALALVVHHFGFLRIVDKNLERILPVEDRRCLFGFIPWKSYLIIAIMVTMGIMLRHSSIPRQYLAILYLGIGLALALSGLRYLRICVREIARTRVS